jgi:hypothetical protein
LRIGPKWRPASTAVGHMTLGGHFFIRTPWRGRSFSGICVYSENRGMQAT